MNIVAAAGAASSASVAKAKRNIDVTLVGASREARVIDRRRAAARVTPGIGRIAARRRRYRGNLAKRLRPRDDRTTDVREDHRVLLRMLELAGPALAATDAKTASEAFFAAVEPLGATYLQTRAYRRPRGRLTSASHWSAGGFIVRRARAGWEGSAAFNYVCFENNPLLDAIRSGRTRYRFSDFAPRGRRYRAYWDALGEARHRRRAVHDLLRRGRQHRIAPPRDRRGMRSAAPTRLRSRWRGCCSPSTCSGSGSPDPTRPPRPFRQA